MYKTKEIPYEDYPLLDNVEIKNQSAIKKKYGYELVLTDAVALIREASGGFNQPNKSAQEVDTLLHELLTKRGFFDDKKKDVPSGSDRFKGKSKPKKKSLRERIEEELELLRDGLEFAEGKLLQAVKDEIELLEEGLEFA